VITIYLVMGKDPISTSTSVIGAYRTEDDALKFIAKVKPVLLTLYIETTYMTDF